MKDVYQVRIVLVNRNLNPPDQNHVSVAVGEDYRFHFVTSSNPMDGCQALRRRQTRGLAEHLPVASAAFSRMQSGHNSPSASQRFRSSSLILVIPPHSIYHISSLYAGSPGRAINSPRRVRTQLLNEQFGLRQSGFESGKTFRELLTQVFRHFCNPFFFGLLRLRGFLNLCILAD